MANNHLLSNNGIKVTGQTASCMETEDCESGTNLFKDTEIQGFQKMNTAICHAFTIGFCGLVITSMGITLESLAQNCNTTAVAINEVFIYRWIGNIVGAALSAYLFDTFNGNHVLVVMLLLNIVFLIGLGFNSSLYLLNFYFFALGVTLSVSDTGVQLLSRRLHSKQSGPWLGLNTLFFSVFGIFGPILSLALGSLQSIYIALSVISFLISLWCLSTRAPKVTAKRLSIQSTNSYSYSAIDDSSNISSDSLPVVETPPKPPHYYVEIAIGFMLFCYIGGYFTATFCIVSYINATRVLSSHEGDILVLVMWLSMAFGRTAGIYFQLNLTNVTIVQALVWMTFVAVVGIITILADTSNKDFLFAGIIIYGFAIGPCVSFSFDLVNRLTLTTPTGMSWVMFGLNAGANLVPMVAGQWWENSNDPVALFYTIFIFVVLSLPALVIARRFAYLGVDETIN